MKKISLLILTGILSFSLGCFGGDSGGSSGAGSASLSLDVAAVSIDAGNTADITATASTADGSADTITAESGDTAIANVSVSGLIITVSGIAEGSATITVTSGSGLTATCEVTVSAVAVDASGFPTVEGTSAEFTITGEDNTDGTYTVYKVTGEANDDIFQRIHNELETPFPEYYLVFRNGNMAILYKLGDNYYILSDKVVPYTSTAGEITSAGNVEWCNISPGTGGKFDLFAFSWAFFSDNDEGIWLELEKVTSLSGTVTNISMADLFQQVLQYQIATFSTGTGDTNLNVTVTYNGSNSVDDHHHVGVMLVKTDYSKTYGNAIFSLDGSNQGTASFTNIPAGDYYLWAYSSAPENADMEIDSEDGDSYEIYNDIYWPLDERDDSNFPAGSTVVTLTAGSTVNISDFVFDDTHKRDVGNSTFLLGFSNITVNSTTISEAGNLDFSIDIVNNGLPGNINSVTLYCSYDDETEQEIYTTLSLTSGTVADGTWSGSLNFSSLNASGPWSFQICVGSDGGGFGSLIDEDGGPTYGYWDNQGNNSDDYGLSVVRITHTASSPDDIPPTMTSLVITDNGTTYTVTLTTSDTGGSGSWVLGDTGAQGALIRLYHQSDTLLDNGDIGGGWGYQISLPPTAVAGVYETTVTKSNIGYSVYTTGNYDVRYIQFYDKIGNSMQIYVFSYYNVGYYTTAATDKSVIKTSTPLDTMSRP